MGSYFSKKSKADIKSTEDVIYSEPYVKRPNKRKRSRSFDRERNILDKYNFDQLNVMLKRIHWKSSCSSLLVSKVSQLQISKISNGNSIVEKILHIVPIKNLENEEFIEYLKIVNECLLGTLSMSEIDAHIIINKLKDYRRHRSNPQLKSTPEY